MSFERRRSGFETSFPIHDSNRDSRRASGMAASLTAGSSNTDYQTLKDKEIGEDKENKQGKPFCSKLKMDATQWRVVTASLCSEFTGIGVLSLLPLFLNHQLNYSKVNSVTIASSFDAVGRFSGLFGGFVSDAYIGKYKTMMYGWAVGSTGTLLVVLSAFFSSIPLLFVGLVLSALGGGSVTPNITSFGADQIPPGPESSERLGTFFYVFYGSINLGAVFTLLVAPIIQTTAGFNYAFLSCLITLYLAIFILWSGRKDYIHTPIKGSVFSQVYRIIVDAWRSFEPYEDHWLDKAKPIHGKRAVEDVKMVWRLLPIFAMLPIFWSLYFQQSNTWELQADDMDRRVGKLEIPTATFQLLNPVLIIIFLFLFGVYIWPTLAKRGWLTKALDRMALGMLLASFAFVLSYGVQQMLDEALAAGSNISIFYQVPQYFMISAAEIMVSTESLEFAYSQAPKSMKSMVTAVYYVTIGIGSLLVGVIFSILNKYLQVKFIFLVFAGAMIVNLGVFLILKRYYVYVDVDKEEEDDGFDVAKPPASADKSENIITPNAPVEKQT